jgi:replicative DNA helicase
MPQARELEEAVLAAVMLEKTAFETAGNILTPDMFYDKTHELIFTACAELEADRKPIDLLTVVEQLRKDGNLEACGGVSYIASLSLKVVSSVHLEYHCLVVKDKYIARRLIEVSSETASLAFDETQEVDETIAKLNSEIERLQEDVVGNHETNHISEAARNSIQQMHVRIANRRDGITPGITTGFAELDRITNGWQPEKFVVLAARPGVGKTSIAIHLAKRAARRGTPVVFFSLEMGETELTDRMIISEADMNADNYNSGAIEPPEWSRAETAMQTISKLPIYIDDNPKVTVGNIVNKARLLKKQGKCKMAIIDYLQLITPNTKAGRNREQEVSEISRLLKVHAKELKIPFIVLCQMNRDIEAEKREPRLSDLRESGSIEQDADIVIFINRPGMYVEELRDKKTGELLENYIELIVKKHRGGKLGKVKIKHNESMTSFYDWDYTGISQTVPVQTTREIKNFYEKEQDIPF